MLKKITAILLVVLGISSCASADDRTLILTLRGHDGVYEVIDAQVVDRVIPPRVALVERSDDLHFQLKDNKGKTLGQGSIGNPAPLRDVNSIDGKEQHTEIQQRDTVFVLRYPYDEGMNVLSMIKGDAQNTTRDTQHKLSAPPAQDITFGHLLKNN
jgi:hypothetical protein